MLPHAYNVSYCFSNYFSINSLYTSTELAKEVAGAPFEKWPKIKVNLDNPDLEINVQIINNRSIIYLTEK